MPAFVAMFAGRRKSLGLHSGTVGAGSGATLPCHGAQHCAGWESCSSGAGGVVTHQVHDEVQLDGEVHDEEDAGPGVPGVRRHHHIWETAFVERYPSGPRLPASGFSEDVALFCLPSPIPPFPCSHPTGFELTRLLPSLTERWNSLSREEEKAPGTSRGQEPKQSPHLLGGGQKDEQADDAALQGAEVLSGKGGRRTRWCQAGSTGCSGPPRAPCAPRSSPGIPEEWQREEQMWSLEASTFLTPVLLAEADNERTLGPFSQGMMTCLHN